MGVRAGRADLPLHGGRVPEWLASRMARLGRVVTEAIVLEYGRAAFLERLSHPFWFQALGAVMGMDWHSSGITTSVLGALKRGLSPVERELGLYVCGGRGRHSRKTPDELVAVGERTGLDGLALARASRLVAKVDSAAVQDGFELYLHGMVVGADGQWVVVQQGMNPAVKTARRYHWRSEGLRDFTDAPHAGIDGEPVGEIVNLVDHRAKAARAAQLELVARGPDGALAAMRAAGVLQVKESPQLTLGFVGPGGGPHSAARPIIPSPEPSGATRGEGQGEGSGDGEHLPGAGTRLSRDDQSARAAPAVQPHLVLPAHHEVLAGDVVLRRLHGALAAAHERAPVDFAELLLTPGVGARTVRSLALVAEVIHGAPCRFTDPARFSYAHGGKDGHPFPVPLKVYDATLRTLRRAVSAAKLGQDERLAALRRLDAQARALEATAEGPGWDALVATERRDSWQYGGRTVFGEAQPPDERVTRDVRNRVLS